MADISECIFLNENIWIVINISLKFVSKGPINNILILFQILTKDSLGNKLVSKGPINNILVLIQIIA